MLRDDNYITVKAFMRTELNLKGSELLTYALIYGFSQDGQSKFQGTAQYVADWLGIDKRNALTVLRKLVDKGLIKKYEKLEKGKKYCDYQVTKYQQTGDKTSPVTGDKTSPHNNSIDNNKENIIKESFSDRQEMWLEIINLWLDYKKKEHKFSYKSDVSFKAFVRNLKKLSDEDVYKAKEIILQSISNGWSGIFALKEDKRNGGGNEHNPYL